MSDVTRRNFLSRAPAVAAALSVPAAAFAIEHVQPQELTPQEKLDQAFAALEAAMIEIHGEGVLSKRNGNRLLCVVEPERPRIVEFAGAGYYEVFVSNTRQPIYWVERSPEKDSATHGRCYRLTPRDAKHLGTHYSYEGFLKTVLIRKI